MEHIGHRYIIPLKRGNREVKGLNLGDPASYPGRFSYRGRAIKFLSVDRGGYKIHVFLDQHLRADESDSYCCRFETSTSKKLQAASSATKGTQEEIKKLEASISRLTSKIEKQTPLLEKATHKKEYATSKMQKAQADRDACEKRLERARDRLARLSDRGTESAAIADAQRKVDFQLKCKNNHMLILTKRQVVLDKAVEQEVKISERMISVKKS